MPGPADDPRPLPMGGAAGLAAGVTEALPALRELLAGRGPLLLPIPADPPPGARHAGPALSARRADPAPSARHADPAAGAATDDSAPVTPHLREVTGVAVGTSGSTGTPKRAVLPVSALRASIDATHEHLGGPGPWVLTLPPHHIAGLQVVLRSLTAGADPILLPPDLPLPSGFVAATASVAAPRWYASIVPAQLGPLLDDPAAAAALRRAAGVLCGGAALSRPLRDRALAAGIALVTTYGMSETAGGCVYDGTPLPGVRARLEAHPQTRPDARREAPAQTQPLARPAAPAEDGRILLGGPSVAAGYLDDPDRSAAAFSVDAAGTRWFHTDDLGRIDAGRHLIVHGRRDDMINTGGFKVHPAVVERALEAALEPTEPGTLVAVIGIPHPRWGQVVAAALVRPGPPAGAPPRDRTAELRPVLGALLPRYAVPQLIVQLPRLPTIGPGKPDRSGLADALTRHATWLPPR